MKQPLLVLHDVSRIFQFNNEKLPVLCNIDLTIYDGEMVAIVGPSGCGKTTLLNILGCLDCPTSGHYSISQQNTISLRSDQLAQLRREYFGFIFQRYYLLNQLTVIENVQLPAIYLGMKKKQRKQRAYELLIQLGLKDRVEFLPKQLSGGQQQRVSIARALMNGGKIILADEPTGALDSKHGAEVMQILHQLHQAGHTIIMVTHDPELARDADRIIELKDGILIKDTGYKNTYQNQQIGDTSKNDFLRLNTQHLGYLREICKTAILAILAHPMRSFLTMLGIIIGITSVVCVVAIGHGAKATIADQFSSFGLKAVHVYADHNIKNIAHQTIPLKLTDASLIAQQPLIDSVSPETSSEVSLNRHRIDGKALLLGVGEQYHQVRDITSYTGKFFSKTDILNHAQLVVIDQNTKKMLFEDDENPIGKTIFIKMIPFKIIGIESTKTVVNYGQPIVLAPYSTVMSRIIGSDVVTEIVFRPRNNVPSEAAQSIVKKALINQHKQEDFFFKRADDLIKMANNMIGIVTLVISSIAFISLLIGSIGIMNIMLVSVAERTYEIGIRMAVGARKKDVLQQFLIEAILICLMGGLAGVMVAFMIGFVFNQLGLGFHMSFSIDSIIFACICSIFIGILFGFLPARRAARLDPAITLTGN